MAKNAKYKTKKNFSSINDTKYFSESLYDSASNFHVYGDNIICDTDSRGYPTYNNQDPASLFVNAPDGKVLLWKPGKNLKWRFQPRSLSSLDDSDEVTGKIKFWMSKAIEAWGDSAPIKFTQTISTYDFEIVISRTDVCDPLNPERCQAAKAFFPGPGRQILTIYPTLFMQSENEKIDTFIHELGHIFGLRHFFAQISETAFPSVTFGSNDVRFSIMDYGSTSSLTELDKSDLQKLYEKAWDGSLTNIDGSNVVLVDTYLNTIAAFENNSISA